MPRTVDLIEAEIPRLRRYARYLARDADRADDLVQECLTRAIAKVESWTPGTNLRAWLFVILRNCHINEVRRGQRTSLIGEMSSDYEVVPTPASQEAHISLLEVRDAYLNLSEEHREVLLLVAIEGLQYEEAAAILASSRRHDPFAAVAGAPGAARRTRRRSGDHAETAPWPSAGRRAMADREILADHKIQDYIDGRLDERDQAIVAAYLLAHPDAASKVETLRRQNEALKGIGQEILDEPVPARLREVLRQQTETRLRRPAKAAHRPASWRPLRRSCCSASAARSAGSCTTGLPPASGSRT